MIKVNLLASAVTEAQAAAPAPKQAQATGQILMIGVAILGLVIFVGVDYYFAKAAADEAKQYLADQEKQKLQLDGQKKELEQYEQKNKIIQQRLAVIKQLAEGGNQGPVKILNAVNTKMPPDGIILGQITQKGSKISIQGVTTNRERATQFAKDLEIEGGGLFTNVSVIIDAPGKQDVTEEQNIKFTIDCVYNPTPPPSATDGTAPATAAATPPAKK